MVRNEKPTVWTVSVHEAGHLIVAEALGHHVCEVWVHRDGRGKGPCGQVVLCNDAAVDDRSKIVIHCGGIHGEQAVIGYSTRALEEVEGDWDRIQAARDRIVASGETCDLNSLMADSIRLIDKHRDIVEAVAKVLEGELARRPEAMPNVILFDDYFKDKLGPHIDELRKRRS